MWGWLSHRGREDTGRPLTGKPGGQCLPLLSAVPRKMENGSEQWGCKGRPHAWIFPACHPELAISKLLDWNRHSISKPRAQNESAAVPQHTWAVLPAALGGVALKALSAFRRYLRNKGQQKRIPAIPPPKHKHDHIWEYSLQNHNIRAL